MWGRERVVVGGGGLGWQLGCGLRLALRSQQWGTQVVSQLPQWIKVLETRSDRGQSVTCVKQYARI